MPGRPRLGPVEDAVERDHRPHRRVDVLEAGLELRVVRGEPHHRGEVAAGRAAGDDDVVGVAAVLGDVLADPRERALAVDEVVGPRRLGREAVVDRDADPAARREVVHERQALLVLVADHPAAAVDLEQHRRARRDVAGAGRCRGGGGAVSSSTYWMFATRCTPRRLNQNGSRMRAPAHVAPRPLRARDRGRRPSPDRAPSRNASANTRSVCSEPFTLDASPNHDASVMRERDPARPRLAARRATMSTIDADELPEQVDRRELGRRPRREEADASSASRAGAADGTTSASTSAPQNATREEQPRDVMTAISLALGHTIRRLRSRPSERSSRCNT